MKTIASLLIALSRLSVARPRRTLLVWALLVVLSLLAAAARLELRSSNLDLIDPKLPEVRAFLDVAEEFGTPNVLVVVLEGADEVKLGMAVDRIAPRLEKVPGVRRVAARLPLDEATLAEAGVEPYLTSTDGTMYFAFVQPADPHSSATSIEPFVRGVRDALSAARLDELGVKAGLTGLPAYALDDKEIIQGDISKLSLISMVMVVLVVVFAFGSVRRPVMAGLALLAGEGMTLGLVAAYPGHLTLLSAFSASILAGLGVDYGIHLVNRVEELTGGGLNEIDAVTGAARALSRGLVSGALTTAAVFFSMIVSGFLGFEELGLIIGAGVLVCLPVNLSLLPALLVTFPPRRRRERPSTERKIGRALLALQSRRVSVLLAIVALAGLAVGMPAFDGNYLNMEPKGTETARLEREMVKRSDLSPEFAIFVASSRAEAAALTDRLLDEPLVGEVHSISDFDLLGEAAARLPASFRATFESPRGRFAVYAYPEGDIWDPVQESRFLEAMERIDPNVTGMPVLGHFMIDRSWRALQITGTIGGLIVLIVVFADFRRPLPSLLASLPVFLTAASMPALMKLLGLQLNPLNVMALPVVVGIGVDEGIHVVHRFVDEAGDVARTLAGTGRSILLTAGTDVAAFGTLAFTQHRGLASFALALTIGVSLAIVYSVIVLPGILDILRVRVLRSAGPREADTSAGAQPVPLAVSAVTSGCREAATDR
ncbi:MAG: MMPL family transporter [Acidobacteria bacterium]|nr:MMPL family transporter [Acidobacteriota bacterium]